MFRGNTMFFEYFCENESQVEQLPAGVCFIVLEKFTTVYNQ